jgi:GNAT superfamily N-acetyltransferase
MKTSDPGDVVLSPARLEDFEELAALRIEAMRDSLERIGRFDVGRARARLRDGFAPDCTRHILVEGHRAGFVTVKRRECDLYLEHFYVHPAYQRRGIGSRVLRGIFAEADQQGLPLALGALRGSDANEFYARHGFVRSEETETEWDIYYVRAPKTPSSQTTGGTS